MKRRRFLNKNRKYSTLMNNSSGKSRRRNRIIIEILLYAVELAVVVGLAYFIIHYGLVKTTMVGDSMNTTLSNGDEVLINKLIYRVASPARNDVVAYSINSEHSNLAIKRIIGLPGERILIKEGAVYINNNKLEEDIEVEPMKTGGLAEEEIKLEDNEYFLLGDNRNNSEDSRFSEIGTIVKKDIIGKVWIKMDNYSFIK